MTDKIVVAGSRSIDNRDTVWDAIIDNYEPYSRSQPFMWGAEIVHGGANGVDTLAGDFATHYGLGETVFEPEWDEYGKAAGPIRNQEMAAYGDMLIAIWDAESHGTRSMIDKALHKGIETHVVIV